MNYSGFNQRTNGLTYIYDSLGCFRNQKLQNVPSAIYFWLRKQPNTVSTALEIISALLITGGYNNDDDELTSAEVWAPGVDDASPLHCNLPSMKRPRFQHTLIGGNGAFPLVCGGAGDGDIDYDAEIQIYNTCEQYTGSGWQELENATVEAGRYGHSAWQDNITGKIYLMGADWDDTSVDIINTSEAVERSSWTLKYRTL